MGPKCDSTHDLLRKYVTDYFSADDKIKGSEGIVRATLIIVSPSTIRYRIVSCLARQIGSVQLSNLGTTPNYCHTLMEDKQFKISCNGTSTLMNPR